MTLQIATFFVLLISVMEFSKAWSVGTVEGNGGLPKIVVESDDKQCSCEVYLFGATLTSWLDNGVERIFVSDLSVYNGVKAIRGGIPLAFPQFSQPNPAMPQHGFARISMWTLLAFVIEDDIAQITLGLDASEATRQLWPHEFKLEYVVRLSRTSLSCSLKVVNLDSSSFECHTLLHTYFRVFDILSVKTTGFVGHHFIDKVNGGEVSCESRETVTLEGEVDRVYTSSIEGSIGDISLEYTDGSGLVRSLRVAKAATLVHGSGEEIVIPTDVVLWNPHIEKARALPDLGEHSYPRFVCIEPGTVSKYVEVAPGSVLTLSHILSSV